MGTYDGNDFKSVGIIDPGKVNLCISGYPRSGNNWLRYIVSHIFTGSFIGKHSFNKYDQFDKLIITIRNYKECVYRHHREYGSPNTQLLDIFKHTLCNVKNTNDYRGIITDFHKFKGKKLLVYYEDLVSRSRKTIVSIADFLDCSSDEFLENYEEHKKTSLKLYPNGKTYTNGDNEIFHSLEIDKQTRVKMDNLIKKYPILVRYLSRYFEGDK